MPAEKATAELHDAMDHFDAKKAESALISLSRSTTPKAALAQLWRYTGRDDSFIGHRAIAMTNSWRVLETIGWEHAEPVFRFEEVRKLRSSAQVEPPGMPNQQ